MSVLPQRVAAEIILFSELPGFEEYRIEFIPVAQAKVSLVSYTSDPVRVLAATTDGYNGRYNTTVHEEAVPLLLDDLAKTKLQTPLEMVHTLWLLEDVSRAFTHQLVRYRVGTAFIQESMRFLGMQKVFRVLVSGKAYDLGSKNFHRYQFAIKEAIMGYVDLLEKGVPSEDARGVLPTNILTKIFFDCSLRTLQGIFPQRLCCQAQQGEWQPILRKMRKILFEEMGAEVEGLLQAPYEQGKPCGYRASFDRPCTWSNSEDR